MARKPELSGQLSGTGMLEGIPEPRGDKQKRIRTLKEFRLEKRSGYLQDEEELDIKFRKCAISMIGLR